MNIEILESKEELGKRAAEKGAAFINEAIRISGKTNIIVATGASQFEMLEELIKQNVDWSKVTAFHLDEYIGLSADHPASFRKYLKERFVDKVSLKKIHYVNGDSDPETECARLKDIIANHPIDVAFVGIGENGHLAFNDPPADFDTVDPYLQVSLDEKCRLQQMGEGWFPDFESVPSQAISMSVKQIMKSKAIICSVSEKRKAEAVKQSVEGKITNMVPASILQDHSETWFFTETDAASMLKKD